MAIDLTDTEDGIYNLIHGGFHSPTEVLEIVTEELFSPDDFEVDDINALTAKIMSVWKNKIIAEQDWPERTDWDRLDAAFDDLFTNSDIMALHATGMTQSDGWDDALEISDELREDGIVPVGTCFYHFQDVDNAVGGHGLHLVFGPLGADATVSAVKIGRAIAETLARHGFTVTWDGTEEQRIHITIDWKKRYAEEEEGEDDGEDCNDRDENPGSETWVRRIGKLFKQD